VTRIHLNRTSGTAKTAALRRAVIAASALIPLTLVLLFALGIGVSAGVGCSACHAMSPYVAAHADSQHPAVSCGACHARSGALGALADGVRVTGWATGALLGRVPSVLAPGRDGCLDCHAQALQEVVTNRGVAVRHSDFIATPCGTCHDGTGHRLEARAYRAPEMDDCLVCHRTAGNNLNGCALCHPADAESSRADSKTSWRVTHGSNWTQTHGMGDPDTCSSCHQTTFCARCHGVKLPHPPDWPRTHGRDLDNAVRADCGACHEAEWCERCHGGIEMPHGSSYLASHGKDSDARGEDACLRCHDKDSCVACHAAHIHPNGPGVTDPGGGIQ